MVPTSLQTNRSTGMRKGSVRVRDFAVKGQNAIQMVFGGERPDANREECLISLAGRKERDVLYFVSNKIRSN